MHVAWVSRAGFARFPADAAGATGVSGARAADQGLRRAARDALAWLQAARRGASARVGTVGYPSAGGGWSAILRRVCSSSIVPARKPIRLWKNSRVRCYWGHVLGQGRMSTRWCCAASARAARQRHRARRAAGAQRGPGGDRRRGGRGSDVQSCATMPAGSGPATGGRWGEGCSSNGQRRQLRATCPNRRSRTKVHGSIEGKTAVEFAGTKSADEVKQLRTYVISL